MNIGKIDKGKNFYTYLAILYLLNIFDMISTYAGLGLGLIEEANPIMRHLYILSPKIFVLAKALVPLILIGVIALTAKGYENCRSVRISVAVAVLVYGILALVHLKFWFYFCLI